MMRHFVWGLAGLLLAGCSLAAFFPQGDQQSGATLPENPSDAAFRADLPNLGAAPELTGEAWLNTDRPLRLADLRGQVVLLEMWTFDCINCIHTLPTLRDWYATYRDQGLVVIGNHYPEFGYERDFGNIRAALTRFEITYPVAQDNDRRTWDAYSNHYWPTIYLIDKWGNIRYRHIGEGAYDRTEQAIRDLLAETYTPTGENPTALRSLTPTTVLNVRSGPGSDQTQIGSIQPGESFIVRGEENGWYRIRYNDQDGFVSGDYVTVSG
ncbi:MAG: SH3 domain-containing protein [Anaerolineae bacterium]|nr:SH3 domain-containing protein [Anaerolineae bacterium]